MVRTVPVIFVFCGSACSDCCSGFPCPLCRSYRNGVLPFTPCSHDIAVKNVLSAFLIHLREPPSASKDVVARAVADFRVSMLCLPNVLFLIIWLQGTATHESNAAFDEARQLFLQTCENVVFGNHSVSAPRESSVDLLSARLLHGHARLFRSCLPYAESHRANSLVFCLLRRINAYQISHLLSSTDNDVELHSELVNFGLVSRLNNSDYMCLRSIIIAATMTYDERESAWIEPHSRESPAFLHGAHQHYSSTGTVGRNASLEHLDQTASLFAEDVHQKILTSFNRPITTEEHPLSSFSMNGKHLLTCNSHIIATLVGTISPSNPHAKCLTAAMLLLHVVAGFCPHLFKPSSMSQPLGMIELASHSIIAVISSGSHYAIGPIIAPLTQALHDDEKLIVSNLISHTMQFVCDIFLMDMVRSGICIFCVFQR